MDKKKPFITELTCDGQQITDVKVDTEIDKNKEVISMIRGSELPGDVRRKLCEELNLDTIDGNDMLVQTIDNRMYLCQSPVPAPATSQAAGELYKSRTMDIEFTASRPTGSSAEAIEAMGKRLLDNMKF